MKLTPEEIRRVTFGATRVEKCENGIRFYRFSEKQIAAYGALNTTLLSNATTTAGVHLDFCTNAKRLAFTAPSGNKFELYVDGLFRKQFLMKEYRERGETATAEITDALGHPAENVRVTLYLPSHSVGVLGSLELDDGATVIPYRYDCKMLMIGDSITQGWNSKYDSLSYALRVARHFNADCLVQGVGGAFFHDTTFDAVPMTPDIVTVAFGTNDFGHYTTYADMRAQTRAHLSLIAKQFENAKIFVLSPIWREHREGKKMGTFENARAIVAEESECLGLIHIDGLSLVPPDPDFFADGYLHPNDNGFSLMAENLIRQIEPHLK